MCLHTRIQNNKKYTKTKKNEGLIPKVKDQRTLKTEIPCGKCMMCRKKKAREWQVRLSEEIKTDKKGKFITFTFSDKSLIQLENAIKENSERNERLLRKNEKNYLTGYNLENEIATVAVRRFLERWRKKHEKSVKHWFVTELGGKNTERIHIHGILFTNEKEEEIANIWKYGNIRIGKYVNVKTINYIVKYLSKTDKKHPNYISKTLVSPGIGKGYLTEENIRIHKFNKENPAETNTTYTTSTGRKIPLPTYYMNKIYTEEEKEKIWIARMDKNIKYLNNIKYEMNKGRKVENNYRKMLKLMREKSKRLGYRGNEIDIEKRKEENNRRAVKRLERYARAKTKQKEVAAMNHLNSRQETQAIYNDPPTEKESGRKYFPYGKLKDAFDNAKNIAQKISQKNGVAQRQ